MQKGIRASKMATGGQNPAERHLVIESAESASLTLDLGQHDSGKANTWKRMPDCDEFVGAR